MNKKRYFFITYGREGREQPKSTVTTMSPAEWLESENEAIEKKRNEIYEANKKINNDLKAKYENMTLWQRLKHPLTKLGREREVFFALLHQWKTDERNPLKTIMNWKEIDEQEYDKFKNILANGVINEVRTRYP